MTCLKYTTIVCCFLLTQYVITQNSDHYFLEYIF